MYNGVSEINADVVNLYLSLIPQTHLHYDPPGSLHRHDDEGDDGVRDCQMEDEVVHVCTAVQPEMIECIVFFNKSFQRTYITSSSLEKLSLNEVLQN